MQHRDIVGEAEDNNYVMCINASLCLLQKSVIFLRHIACDVELSHKSQTIVTRTRQNS